MTIAHTRQKLLSFLRGSLIGVLTGLAITIFTEVVHIGANLNERYPYLIILLPLAAFLTQYIYNHYGSIYKEGTVVAIDEINEDASKEDEDLATTQIKNPINPVLALINLVTTFFTHLFGASGGKEGSGVQIGLVISSLCYKLEQKLFKTKEKYSSFLICGASSAFAALFNAPVAGILFGTRFANPSISRLESYLSCIGGSFFAVFVSQKMHIHTLHFAKPIILKFSATNFFIVLGFAVLVGLLSILITKAMHITKEKCQALTKNQYINVIVPATLLMVITLSFLLFLKTNLFQGMGSTLLTKLVAGERIKGAFIFKLLLIVLTYASSFTGGEVVPLLILGATFGSTFASLFSLPLSTFATLGAIGMLSGGTNLPLVCFALGFELFNYSDPTLLFVLSTVSFIFSGISGIYKHQKNPY